MTPVRVAKVLACIILCIWNASISKIYEGEDSFYLFFACFWAFNAGILAEYMAELEMGVVA